VASAGVFDLLEHRNVLFLLPSLIFFAAAVIYMFARFFGNRD
jgi:hypothetical protein